jgi:hypothetical protein
MEKYKLRLTTKAYKLSYNYLNYTINLVGRSFGSNQYKFVADLLIIIIKYEVSTIHVRWDPCPHSMARPRLADGGTASRYGG